MTCPIAFGLNLGQIADTLKQGIQPFRVIVIHPVAPILAKVNQCLGITIIQVQGTGPGPDDPT